MPATPSGNRHRMPFYGNNSTAMKTNVGGDAIRQGTPYRSALNNIDPNVYGNSNAAGYGMSAGVKVGRQATGPISRSGYGAGNATGIPGLNMR